MSDQIKEDAELITELPESEQESVAGGFAMDMFDSFFFQQTDISTFGEAEYNNPSDGGSYSQRTGYKLSQLTLAFSSRRFGGRRTRYGRSRMGGIFNFLRGWRN